MAGDAVCEVCAREVGEALQGEGLMDAAVAQVLTHLELSAVSLRARLTQADVRA
jgi:hypothetical protein